jgi:regulator of protease activity HflC (stomatin/prohibitin superfamily)
MGTQIKEGEALIVGRGDRDTAVALLKAADDTGQPVESVRMDGFVVPTVVADAYEEALGAKANEVRRREDAAAAAAAEEDGEVVGAASITGSNEGEAGDTGAEAPAKSASKGDWEAYAASQGYDAEEGLTKDQLIERYGVSE